MRGTEVLIQPLPLHLQQHSLTFSEYCIIGFPGMFLRPLHTGTLDPRELLVTIKRTPIFLKGVNVQTIVLETHKTLHAKL